MNATYTSSVWNVHERTPLLFQGQLLKNSTSGADGQARAWAVSEASSLHTSRLPSWRSTILVATLARSSPGA